MACKKKEHPCKPDQISHVVLTSLVDGGTNIQVGDVGENRDMPIRRVGSDGGVRTMEDPGPTWWDFRLCVPRPLGVGQGGRWGWGKVVEMEKAGEKRPQLVPPSAAGLKASVPTGLAGNKRSEEGWTSHQPALPEGFPPARHVPSRFWMPPSPVVWCCYRFPVEGERPGEGPSKWPVDNAAQELGWQILGLHVGTIGGGVELVANCGARACLKGLVPWPRCHTSYQERIWAPSGAVS